MQHAEIWRAIDALAQRKGLTASGLARAAGLDPTSFNKSKRQARDGKGRWPSTESLARAIAAAGSNWEEFAACLGGREGDTGRPIPIFTPARAGAAGFFDAQGFPVGAKESVRFPDLGAAPIYALEITDDCMAPLLGVGAVVIVQPGAPMRRGDRVVVRTLAGEVMVRVLGRCTEQATELLSPNSAYATREVISSEIDWMARIVWASQ
jgi:phage repressor protein C with HTH and peptisase S24 domain